MTTAPIQRYSDPRLYGTAIVKPFAQSYEWIRTVANPWHPKCSLIEECAVRAMKVVTGLIALVLTIQPALVGRCIQILHYHLLSQEGRNTPPEVVFEGFHLPKPSPCELPHSVQYLSVNQDRSMAFLRWGFSTKGLLIQTAHEEPPPVLQDKLILSLDIRKEEVALFKSDDYVQFIHDHSTPNFPAEKVDAVLQELFYRNGYRAIKDHEGLMEGWSICDPSCVSVTKLCPTSKQVLFE